MTDADRSPVNASDASPSLIDWLLAQAADDVQGDEAAVSLAEAVAELVEYLTEPLELGTLTGGNVVRLLVPKSAGTRGALQRLALAYAHRPGYRTEWMP